ncbi:MAG: hypothetical protein WCO56_07155 [Verrucomicrobiota bacterium]
MAGPVYLFALLLTLAFSMAAGLVPWHQQWSGARGRNDSLLATVFGDSRRLFSNHFFVKADVYYHMGFYPGIFDLQSNERGQIHMAEDAGLQAEHDEGAFFRGTKPLDWLDSFERNFHPSTHVHADDKTQGSEREILPWLKVAAELDPQRIETYTVAAFWLRKSMKRPEVAEQFLREGLRNNPGNAQILFELGRIFLDEHHDLMRSRNVQELALRKWRENEAAKPESDPFLLEQILGQLVFLERQVSNWSRVLDYLRELRSLTPNPDAIDKQIQEVRELMAKPGGK